MARRFIDQVMVGRDASAPLEALTKQQYDAAKDAVGGFPVLDAGIRLLSARMPIVPSPIRSGSASSSLTSDASSGAGNFLDIAITGNATINAPTNPVNWQTFRWHLLASGAARTITFGGGIIAGGAGLGPYVVPRGSVLIAEAEYIGNRTNTSDVSSPAWALTVALVTDVASAIAAHASTHATGGSDPIAPSDIGAAPLASPTFTGTVQAGLFSQTGASGGTQVRSVGIAGDTSGRWVSFADGYMRWGPGNATGDVDWYRDSAGVLRTAGRIVADDGLVANGAVTLTDGTTVALNAAQHTRFRLAAAGNRTILVPTNPTDGQVITIEHTAVTSARTLALTTGTGGFLFGSDITALTATVAAKTDIIQATYNTTANRWWITGYIKGF